MTNTQAPELGPVEIFLTQWREAHAAEEARLAAWMESHR